MSRLSRISLAFVLLMSSEVWALGLGDIRMHSALNEPLNARIELLSATPEELDNLTVAMASADTFARYGIDRPFYLQNLQFSVVRSGRADGNFVQVRSTEPMAEPFLTFLVEASWARGRLLREYTVFLDPPTFTPPAAAETTPAVQAPIRSAPSDSGQIQRSTPPPAPPQQATPRPAPVPAPRQTTPAVEPEPVVDDRPFDSTPAGDLVVARGDTLWGVASRMRPDSRLTMNQTMLAIFEANPDAFGGNINVLRAGVALRIPSADEIFQINRADALAEAQRQHAEWGGGSVTPVADTAPRPSLTLVPPDDDFGAYDSDAVVTDAEPVDPPLTREEEILDRIAEIEAAGVPDQPSLIEIQDNELAALRQELAEIRGEIYEPPVEEIDGEMLDESLIEDVDADLMVDDEMADDEDADPFADADEDAAVVEAEPDATTTIASQPAPSEPSLVDRALEFVTGIYGMIAGAVIVVLALLFWFMRRGRGDEEEVESWQPLDSDDLGADDDLSATESLRAPTGDESFVVVEQESGVGIDETVDVPAPIIEEEMPPAAAELGDADETAATGQFGSLEDTFSSETAINLDQSDPIAEADFHMAYGLYDQAADLVNGALQIEPDRTDLLTKLCEIYFVWGNRDAFIDAAGRLKNAVGDGDSADWDKIVIMGQQIASDDELFAGASAAGATKAVDLSFEGPADDTGSLDMDFGVEGDDVADVVDLGAAVEEDTQEAAVDEGVDFVLDEGTGADIVDLEPTAESPTVEATTDFDITREMPAADETAEMPAADDATEIAAADDTGEMPAMDETSDLPAPDSDDTAEMPAAESTVETPTIEQQFDVMSGTAELPSLDEGLGDQAAADDQAGDATAEINLDDLGLDVDSLAETELANLDELDVTGNMEALSDTGIHEQSEDVAAVTGKNPEIDPDSTGVREALGSDEETVESLVTDTGINEAPDPTLLDATGVTQVLSSDMAVDTTTQAQLSDDDATMLASLSDDDTGADDVSSDAETMLASLDDDDSTGDFDFAKTEALPKEAFTGEHALDETGEMPAVASTDVELDLDDLTAALEVSDAGDTVEQPRDDATVEQPRPVVSDDFSDDTTGTVALEPGAMDDDLTEARTMTEVGTKLDLARAYVDMGDPSGARSILEEVLDEGDDAQRQQAQQLLDSLPN